MTGTRKAAGTLIFYWRYKMTEEVQQQLSTGEMLRITGKNTEAFMVQVADHIDALEKRVIDLENKLNEQN